MTTQNDELAAIAALRPTATLSGYALKIKSWIAENESKRAFNAVKVKDTLELNMLDVIGQDWWTGGGITSEDVKAALDANPDIKTIKVVMNSPGGDAWEGISIRSLLARHGARVEVEVLGLCASAATVIAMAGDSIAMHTGTMFMVHRAWTFTGGNAVELGKVVNFLQKIDSNIIDLYRNRTGRSRTDLQKLVDEETWMTADEAVSEKFATSVVVEKDKKTMDKKDTAPAAAASSGQQRPQKPASQRAFYAPENRLLIANFRRYAASAVGESWPTDDEAKQHVVLNRYLVAFATGKGIQHEGFMQKANDARTEMEASGIPLMPVPPSAA